VGVFHLKYRPERVGDLDLPEVSNKLRKILAEKEMPQSFLFSGPKGSGKTSAARIVARAINCESLKDGEPCGKCESCLEIQKGSSIDVVEIDAASNRGIDDVRLLKDKAYFLPSRLKKKVFVIDEVHMLTKEAFNALLKLIEEPPKHTIFILCTTDYQKIPETVLSRLVRVDFRRGKGEELMESLAKVIKGEKIKVDKKAIEMIVERSDGSFRNLHRIFNELVLEQGREISEEKVAEYFRGSGGDYREEDLENDLMKGEASGILKRIEIMAGKGVDFGMVREDWVRFFQRRLVEIYGQTGKKTEGLGGPDLRRWLGLLILAGKQEKEAVVPQLPLELAVAEFLSSKFPPKADQPVAEKVQNSKFLEEKVVEKKEEAEQGGVAYMRPVQIEGKWKEILTAVKPFNHSVEAFLRAARPKAVKEKMLVLEVYYPFHKDRLEEARNRQVVEEALYRVLGCRLGLKCVLGQSRKAPLEIRNDTPVEKVSEELVEEPKDIYDVAKEIFG